MNRQPQVPSSESRASKFVTMHPNAAGIDSDAHSH